MRILTTLTGSLVVVEHITTIEYTLDEAALRKDRLAFWMAEKDIKEAEANPDYQKQLQIAMDKQFPEGKPEVSKYYRTRVWLSDSSVHWVNASRDDVVKLVLAG